MSENKNRKSNSNSNKPKSNHGKYTPPSEFQIQLTTWLLALVGVFFAFCLFLPMDSGFLGKYSKIVFAGLFSWGAYFIPIIFLCRSFSYKKEVSSAHPDRNWVLSLILVVFISVLCASIKCDVAGYSIKEHFTSAIKGGSITTNSVIGGIIANLLVSLIGKTFTVILSVACILFLVPFLFSKTPLDFIRFIFLKARDKYEENSEIRKERKEYYKEKQIEEKEAKKTYDFNFDDDKKRKNKKPKIEEDLSSDADITDTELDGVEITEKSPLEQVFAEDEEEAEIPVTKSNEVTEEIISETTYPAENDKEEEEEPLKDDKKEAVLEDNADEELYKFPPLYLLKKGNPPTPALEAEYDKTATKLVEKLASFNVKTKVYNISKGPTVTRYELQPETGVRVRAIRNLADDIALSLAAKGVRIEAPIPGKEAVGIEVPNKNPSIVTIRELVESETFEKAKSKLNACLGVDVGGNPVYCDIAKMPHIIIAGTTGSGKSVCINSLLVSILYKATPNEVKLILIDPKTIEFSIYNGIPHLLVPVVSDPKKAAGALAWAVNEMERRYALIAEAHVRDIKAYNEIMKENDCDIMPQIVIVIDELADLMMMARDAVEGSICRIAQKARAAGIHLVIGTQRPSVDVITGVIKANVPSRIAFTVASQVDSRTIIDVQGAEKLIGNGDMLYSPTGCNNPLRVQGSFVSDGEIESIIEFIKENSTTSYDENIANDIENQAKLIGEKKTHATMGDDDDDDGEKPTLSSDPMLKSAVEIALDNGTVSTSLLQRRLSVGYARAARIIDQMEEMGIVSEYAGSKPRTILISREQYIEMLTNSEG